MMIVIDELMMLNTTNPIIKESFIIQFVMEIPTDIINIKNSVNHVNQPCISPLINVTETPVKKNNKISHGKFTTPIIINSSLSIVANKIIIGTTPLWYLTKNKILMIEMTNNNVYSEALVNKEKCISCEICIKICPVGAISWEEKS